MAGHSKWANIRYRKGRQDAARGKLWGKLTREVIVAAREGGGDPDTNARLRNAVQAARDANMPNDNIERAIKRGTGELEGVRYEEAMYEGYGPAGVALLIHVLTDNTNRAVAEIRSLMTKQGASLGEAGCVAWMFDKKGLVIVDKDAVEEEALLEAALEGGAEDMREEDDTFEITTAFEDLQEVRAAVEALGVEPSQATISMVPQSTVPVPDNQARKVLALLDALEDHDDVRQVYANFDISAEVLASAA